MTASRTRRQFAFDNVQVGPADAAGAHAQQDLARARRPARNVAHAQDAV